MRTDRRGLSPVDDYLPEKGVPVVDEAEPRIANQPVDQL
jgi:hypothetical protein